MKIQIADRDKRMLLVLLLFFAALGYYYLILIPLKKLSADSDRELAAKKNDFELTQVNVSRFQSWQGCNTSLGGRLSEICRMVKAPFLDKSAPDRIEAIMRAANKSGITVENIKPVATSTQMPDGSPLKTVNRFIIDGNCTFDSFMSFLREIYGMKLIQFTISAGSSGQDSLRFYTVLESNPKAKLDLPFPKNAKAPLPDYRMKHNLFTLKKSQAEQTRKANKAKPLTPEEIREEKIEQLQARLSGLKLEGTATIGNEKLAVIADPNDTESTYRSYRVGDKVRGVNIVTIKEYEVELQDDEKIPCTLQLTEPTELQPDEQASKSSKSFQHGSWFESLAKNGRQDIVVSFRES